MTSKMTIERARKLKAHYLTTDEVYPGDLLGSDWATGFIEGHESRDAEVEELKDQLNHAEQILHNPKICSICTRFRKSIEEESK